MVGYTEMVYVSVDSHPSKFSNCIGQEQHVNHYTTPASSDDYK